MIAPLTSAVHALGSQAAIGSLGSEATAGTGASATGSASFGSQLTGALSSLDQTQQTASTAAQGLATGTISDPTQAITAVENASLTMDLAAQVRDKLVSAENQIFQTQV